MTSPTQLTRLGLLLPAALTVWIAAQEPLGPLSAVLGTLCCVYGLGLGLMETRFRRAGARIVLVASVLVLPTGIPGALGARGVLDELDRQPNHS